jgi:uncharacterized protein YacL
MSQSTILRIAAGTIGVIVLLILATWALGGFATLSANGDIALVLGITITVGLGVGLMVLVFQSSRSERDEAVHFAADDRRRAGSKPGSSEPRRRP